MAENLVLDSQGLWVSPDATTVEYDSHGAHYSVEDGSFWFQHRNRIIVETLGRWRPTGPVLDVGGGNGFVAAAIHAAGFDTLLVEPGRNGALNARRRGLPHVVCATVEAARFRPGCMGGIGLFDVLEHIEDDTGFLVMLRKLLGTGGRLYLTVPAYRWLWSVHDTNEHHFRRYTVARLSAACGDAGFRVLTSSYFFWTLPLPVLVMRTLPTRMGILRPGDPHYLARDHRGETGGLRRVMEALLAKEAALLAGGGRIPFGTSCLVVAQRD